ncbi:hypothetical protein L2729_01140 [Shewanella gelidimarina]|uniref:hypothetical protein n=1 Tax=Shewanella gelidimarina TaxID=56813 RepID=UPI00200DFDBA|nr:hypothetical protein [Shewanella gelidimarina]MCL1056593.1 hypothetical protein [Shewanella gelidimarina]
MMALKSPHIRWIFGVFLCFISSSIMAADEPSLAERGETAKERSLTIEQEQLKKAREASSLHAEQEEKLLSKAEPSDWESQQYEKAQQHFEARESREEKYLREAKEAASKERKMPKPIKD